MPPIRSINPRSGISSLFAAQGLISPRNAFVEPTGEPTPVSFRFLESIFHAVGDLQINGVPGPPGPAGPPGADSTVPGPVGPGVAPGGTAGQVLTKVDATDYNTHWVTPAGGGGGGIPEAPLTGLTYGRQSAGWTQVLMASGDVIDGGNF